MKYLYALAARLPTGLFIFLAALSAAWALASLTWPFGWDQGIFAWVGDVINRGGLPYRDAWEIKGPLTYYLFALVQFIFGSNQWGIRLFDLALIITAAAMLFILVRQLTNPIVAGWAAVLFVLWYASGNYWHTAQPDGWVSMLMIIALTPMLVARVSLRWYQLVLAGILIGSACLIKPLYVLFLFLAFVIAFQRGWPDKKQILRMALMLTAGFAIPLAIAVAWFAYQNALPDLFEQYIIYNLTIYAGGSLGSVGTHIKAIIDFLLSGEVILPLIPVVGLGLVVLWRSSRQHAIALGLWALIAFLIVVVQNRFFKYHCLLLCPSITVLSAVGFHQLFFPGSAELTEQKGTLRKQMQLMGALLLIVVIFQTAIHPLFEVSKWVSFISQRIDREEYYAGFGDIPYASIQAADYIREHTAVEDRIYVWGWDAVIYYLSGRQSSTRFGFSMPLLMGEGTEIQAAYRREFLASLKANPPVYIVIGPQSELILGRECDLCDFQEFADLVDCRLRRGSALRRAVFIPPG